MTSQIQKAEDAHKIYKDLVQTISIGRMAVARLGMQLYTLKKDNVFKKAIGEGIDTWEEFLKLPEIAMDPREANRSIGIYEEFVLKRGYSTDMLSSVPTKALHYLLPVAKAGQVDDSTVEELLHAGSTLSQASFRERLYDTKRENTADVGERTYDLLLMRRCHQTGTLQKVSAVKSEMLKEALTKYGLDVQSIITSISEIV